VKKWLKEIDLYGLGDVPKIIVGCKSDLASQRVVDRETAVEFCDSLQIEHMETSAKKRDGVEDVFFRAVRLSEFSKLSFSCFGEGEVCMTMKCMSSRERRSISTLDLSNNMLSHIPQEVFLCEHLVRLEMADNCLTALPVSLLRLPGVSITLLNNPLVSSMPNKETKLSPEMLRQYFAAQFCEQSIVCAAMIWRFRESVWRLLGRDVMKIIAAMLWRTRGDTRCWVNEAAIVSMEEQEKKMSLSSSKRHASASCAIQ
jgi:Leucine-rich repeat (LRR) protein